MKIALNHPIHHLALWRFMCIFALLIFLAAVTATALLIRQKRYRLLWASLPVLCAAYFMEQCFDMYVGGFVYSDAAARIVNAIASIPDWLLLAFCAALAFAQAILMQSIRLYEKSRISTMSVKEATDSLPTGILCYAPGIRVLLVNRAMQDFCRKITGAELEDGETFYRFLEGGELLPACSRVMVGGKPVIVLPDRTAWKISENDIPYEKHTVRMVLASDITEVYRKTQKLREMQRRLEKLGQRLQKVNREVVALTAERELLNAKVRIHDEMGSNLLAIKRFLLNGGTEAEKAALMDSLHRSVAFLKNDSPARVQDEYELLISMASRLGLHISIAGELPQTEPHKHIMAAAIHECLTNTLRHAHGDELRVDLSLSEDTITAIFTNNGEQPEAVSEKGGLKSLRELAEQAGGSMAIEVQPVFTVTIKLPKEETYVL